ncbi:hypothetical protein CgunFtcFv8_021303 [Champsocephalus gunnari]|uniref:Uncharacterized protein n=1 Tax=Champsocephalus gunnari TaxID=52237 RepID=A0AAN8E7D5_CHAGU|nr:hypothetical protein CgunFtcFv8_021303 [Champsocephalus gunnari]
MVQRWPALFTESQVYCEFNRVVGKNLKDNFFDALDCFSPSMIDLFRKKKGVTGQFLSELLRQTKTTEPTDIRCLCLRGLPIILGDEPSAFFKTCTDAADKEHLSYPKDLANTFDFTQKVLMGLDEGNLKPRVLSLKKLLAV